MSSPTATATPTPRETMKFSRHQSDRELKKSPRMLRRARTQEDFNTKYKKELERLSSQSEKIRRKHNPDRHVKKLLDTMSKFPRPRSASNSDAFLHTLNNIRDCTYSHTEEIRELELKPDLHDAIVLARRSNDIKPLLEWPQGVWTEDNLRQLLFRRGVVLEYQIDMTVMLAEAWLESYNCETAFREDGAAKTLLTFIMNELDDWYPTPGPENPSLFWQCYLHYMELPKPIPQLLERIIQVANLLPEVMLRAINLNVMMPRALKAGFTTAQLREVMVHFFTPSEKRAPRVQEIYRCLSTDYQPVPDVFV